MSENKKLVSDRIVDYLERRGVEYVFGLCGHTVIGLLDGIHAERSAVSKYVLCRRFEPLGK